MTRVTSAGTLAGMTRKAPPKKPAAPVPLAERVRASEGRKIAGGGRRLPGVVMPPDAAEALAVLQANAYGSSASGCIFRALIDAAERFRT